MNDVVYDWDNNGNLINDGVHVYTYNAADRLISVSGGGVSANYTYNGDGLLARQDIGGVSTTFTWDVAAGLPQVLATSSGARYLYGLGLLAQQPTAGGAWQYPLVDGLGSIRYLTDPLGAPGSQYSFDPFGVPLSQDGGGQPFGYAGEQWDANTNLIYLRARWYNPSLGRFLTRDPFPGMAALPSTQNPYVYGLNNPANLTDPSGRIAFLVAAGIGAAIGGTAAGMQYVMAHPGQRPEDYLQNAGFQQAVGVGALSGGVAGAVGFFAAGVAFGGGWGGAMASGIFSGALSGVFGQVTTNLAMGCSWHRGALEAGVTGGLIGGITGGLGYGIGRLLSPAATGGESVGGALRAGEAGSFGDLDIRRVPGDDLTPHHMPQNALGWTSPDEGGALMMTHAEHAQTRTYFGRGAQTAAQDAGRPFRDVLAADIRDVRSIVGNRYNRGLLDLIQYYETNFPQLIKK